MLPNRQGRLNPIFEIDGKTYAMVAQYAAAIELRALESQVASFGDRRHDIIDALDMLLTGV